MSSMALSFLVWKKRKEVSGESRRGRQSHLLQMEGWLSLLERSDGARAGCTLGEAQDATVRPAEAHVQPRQVTGLETWWGATAICVCRESGVGPSRLVWLQLHPPTTPTDWLSPVVSERCTPHIRQTMDGASILLGPGSFLPSFRPKAWVNRISL